MSLSCLVTLGLLTFHLLAGSQIVQGYCDKPGDLLDSLTDYCFCSDPLQARNINGLCQDNMALEIQSGKSLSLPRSSTPLSNSFTISFWLKTTIASFTAIEKQGSYALRFVSTQDFELDLYYSSAGLRTYSFTDFPILTLGDWGFFMISADEFGDTIFFTYQSTYQSVLYGVSGDQLVNNNNPVLLHGPPSSYREFIVHNGVIADENMYTTYRHQYPIYQTSPGFTLIHYWPLNELVGNTLHEEIASANSITFTENTDAVWVNSDLYICLHEAQQSAENTCIPHTGILKKSNTMDHAGIVSDLSTVHLPNSNVVSVQFWIKPLQLNFDCNLITYFTFFTLKVNSASQRLDLLVDVTGESLTSTNVLSLGNWHFITVVIENGNAYLYFNETLEGTSSGSVIAPGTPAGIVLVFPADPTTNDFQGYFCELRIYNKVVDVASIQLYSRHFMSENSDVSIEFLFLDDITFTDTKTALLGFPIMPDPALQTEGDTPPNLKFCSVGRFYDATSDSCQDCIEGCKYCLDKLTCVICDAQHNFVLTSSNICECNPAGFFNNSGKCTACHSWCASCQDGTNLNCPICKPGYLIYQTGCVDVCPTDYLSNGTNCVYQNLDCGNGGVDANEVCDDGNTVSGDGCDSSCQIETGYSCPVPGQNCMPICGDGLIVGSEQCDDGNVNPFDGCDASCQIEPTSTCLPGAPSICSCQASLLSATWMHNWSRIEIQFSRSITLASTQLENVILSASTLFSATTSIMLDNTNNQTIIIQVGTNSPMLNVNTLSFVSGSIQTANCIQTSSYQATLTFDPNNFVPKTKVIGATAISRCQKLLLDASSSTSGSIYLSHLQFHWSTIDQASNEMPLNSAQSYLELSFDDVMALNSLQLRLRVTNVLGENSHTDLTITLVDDYFPYVLPLEVPTQPFYSFHTITLGVQLFYNCTFSPSPFIPSDLSSQWAIVADEGQLNQQTMDFFSSSNTTGQPLLFIPPFTLPKNQKYNLTYQLISKRDSSVSIQYKFQINVIQNDLISRITGGDRRASVLRELTLNGSLSLDPDVSTSLLSPTFTGTQGLTYSWTCWNYSDVSYVNNPCEFNNTVNGLIQNSPILTVPPYSLFGSNTYKFCLEVSKDVRSSSSCVIVETFNEDAPTAVIEVPLSLTNQKINPSLSIILNAITTSKVPDNLHYNWTQESGPTLDSQAYTTSLIDVKFIKIKPFMMSSEDFYAWKLVVFDVYGVGTANYTLNLNSPPSKGVVKISPNEGVVMSTLFKFDCQNWNDEDLPLSFQHFLYTSAGLLPITRKLFTTTVWAKIIIDELTNNTNITVKTKIYDAFDSFTEVSTPVMLHPSNTLLIEDLVDQMNSSSREDEAPIIRRSVAASLQGIDVINQSTTDLAQAIVDEINLSWEHEFPDDFTMAQDTSTINLLGGFLENLTPTSLSEIITNLLRLLHDPDTIYSGTLLSDDIIVQNSTTIWTNQVLHDLLDFLDSVTSSHNILNNILKVNQGIRELIVTTALSIAKIALADAIPEESVTIKSSNIIINATRVGAFEVQSVPFEIAPSSNIINAIKSDQEASSICLHDETFMKTIFPPQNLFGLEKRNLTTEVANNEIIVDLKHVYWTNETTLIFTNKSETQSQRLLSNVTTLEFSNISSFEKVLVQNLTSPISFCHLYTENTDGVFCGYYDWNSSKWSNEGCQLIKKLPVQADMFVAICQCNHLTDFGVLIQSIQEVIKDSYFSEIAVPVTFESSVFISPVFISMYAVTATAALALGVTVIQQRKLRKSSLKKKTGLQSLQVLKETVPKPNEPQVDNFMSNTPKDIQMLKPRIPAEVSTQATCVTPVKKRPIRITLTPSNSDSPDSPPNFDNSSNGSPETNVSGLDLSINDSTLPLRKRRRSAVLTGMAHIRVKDALKTIRENHSLVSHFFAEDREIDRADRVILCFLRIYGIMLVNAFFLPILVERELNSETMSSFKKLLQRAIVAVIGWLLSGFVILILSQLVRKHSLHSKKASVGKKIRVLCSWMRFGEKGVRKDLEQPEEMPRPKQCRTPVSPMISTFGQVSTRNPVELNRHRSPSNGQTAEAATNLSIPRTYKERKKLRVVTFKKYLFGTLCFCYYGAVWYFLYNFASSRPQDELRDWNTFTWTSLASRFVIEVIIIGAIKYPLSLISHYLRGFKIGRLCYDKILGQRNLKSTSDLVASPIF